MALLVLCDAIRLPAPPNPPPAAVFAYPDVWQVPFQPVSSSGLSTGAIVGIAVGCSMGAIALAVGLFLWFLRRRRHREASKSTEGQEAAAMQQQTWQSLRQGQQFMTGGGEPPSQLAQAQQLYQSARQGADLQQSSASVSNPDSASGTGTLPADGDGEAALLCCCRVAAGPVALASLGERRAAHAQASHASPAARPQLLLPHPLPLPGPPSPPPSSLAPVGAVRSGSHDPLLEWIIKSQGADSSNGTGTPSSAQTRRASRSAAKLADMRDWNINFSDLEVQKQIGEGSFGRVRPPAARSSAGAWRGAVLAAVPPTAALAAAKCLPPCMSALLATGPSSMASLVPNALPSFDALCLPSAWA